MLSPSFSLVLREEMNPDWATDYEISGIVLVLYLVCVCVFATTSCLVVSLHDSLNSTDGAPVPALSKNVQEFPDSRMAPASGQGATGLFTFLMDRKDKLL